MGINIAIDGPAGAGKSSIAKAVAHEKGYIYVDTGALYRSIALFALENSLEGENLVNSLDKINLSLEFIDGSQHVIMNNNDISDKIRTPEVSMNASKVSAIPEVRKFLFGLQKKIAAENNIIMDGRDIGTVVLPNADVKIFLVANADSRAKRRCEELKAKGQNVNLEEIKNDMSARDKQDSERKTAPCVPAHDAVTLDDSDLTLEQTTEKALEIIHEKINEIL